MLRTGLLPREMMNRKGSAIRLRIGSPISCKKLRDFESDEAATDYLRLRAYILKNRDEAAEVNETHVPEEEEKELSPLAAPLNPDRLEREIGKLGAKNLLVEHKEYVAYYASAWQIPETLQEIGRLRELTFRASGEGTGRPVAMERCDRYYLHLFLWNRKTREIVGGYRMGQTDRIVRHLGREGLYSSKLFKYREELFRRLNPALELGRSFIRPEYQRKHTTLALVWRGIGEYVARNPQYHVLFGPVSTSREYMVISRGLIMEYLKSHLFDNRLAQFVRAKNPPERPAFGRSERKIIQHGLRDVEDLSTLVSEIEQDRKGIPVLLKHYLKLNGIIVSFNVDNEFSDVMDSLIVVDLLRSDSRILKRYLGEEGLKRLYDYHAERGEAVA